MRALLIIVLAVTVVAPVHARQGRVEIVAFKSALMGAAVPYGVVLPEGYESSTTRYPVLYLLHGLFGHHTDWLTRTNLADYASRYQIIVVTPEGGDGWYTDSAGTPADKHESYIVRELIPDVDNRFRTIRDRRARAVAGLSMGGYGALKFAVKYPDQFALAASMSGALDPAVRSDASPGFAWDLLRPSVTSVFGAPGSPTRAANDLHRLFRELPQARLSSLPFLYLDCGTEDGFLGTNRELAEILLERKIPHEYTQTPGGHDWGYWDARVRYVLELAARRMPLGRPRESR